MDPLYNNEYIKERIDESIFKIIDILYSYFNLSGNSEVMIDYMNCAEEILEEIKENIIK